MSTSPAISGTITDIQRFSLNDGPGIRTTVFFKGCNMRCAWCHNPETINPNSELQFFSSKCIDCGNCRGKTGSGKAESVAFFTDEEGVARYDRGNCHAEALVRIGRRVSAEDILGEAVQDKKYYTNSGGGVTISGGEVTVQTPFARQTLQLLKANGIHAAIETNLAAPWERIQSLLPLLDLVIFDIKHLDCATHRAWTGLGNEQILENARRLGNLDLPVVVRTPVIPGFNDSIRAISDIAAFAAKLPALNYYELLAFNPLGADKYRCLGKPYLFQDTPMVSDAFMKELSCAAEQHGIQVRIS